MSEKTFASTAIGFVFGLLAMGYLDWRAEQLERNANLRGEIAMKIGVLEERLRACGYDIPPLEPRT